MGNNILSQAALKWLFVTLENGARQHVQLIEIEKFNNKEFAFCKFCKPGENDTKITVFVGGYIIEDENGDETILAPTIKEENDWMEEHINQLMQKFSDQKKEQQLKSRKEIIIKVIGVCFLLVIGFVILLYILNYEEDSSSKSRNDQIDACGQRTNTYYKCSWSIFEGRCVCKTR